MIRQAISCDICASEKRQTNHWFVAYEQAGELRVSGWSSRHKLRPGSKHLCGQTCLHKLVDEFMAKAIAVRAQRPVEEPAEEIAQDQEAVVDASLISEDPDAHDYFYNTINAPFVGDGFTRWVDGQYALDKPELGLSNWEHGRLFARGGVLSGDGVFTVRTRARQTDPALRR